MAAGNGASIVFLGTAILVLAALLGRQVCLADDAIALNAPDQNQPSPADLNAEPEFGLSVIESKVTAPSRNTTTFAISEKQARSNVQWLAELAIRKAPRTYTGDKGWGDTKEVWSGLKLRRDGLKLRTKRRTKDVRHGRWIKYELTLPQPAEPGSKDPNSVVATIHRVRKVGGDLQPGVAIENQTTANWEITSSVETPMRFTARVERWNRGIQLISLSISGHLRVRLDSKTSLAFYADYAEVPPAFVIDPKVLEANLDLIEFEVERVSKIGGDVADEWGEIMEDVVRDVFLKKQNEKLAGKLNKSIDKNRDDLRISMADWFSKW